MEARVEEVTLGVAGKAETKREPEVKDKRWTGRDEIKVEDKMVDEAEDEVERLKILSTKRLEGLAWSLS